MRRVYKTSRDALPALIGILLGLAIIGGMVRCVRYEEETRIVVRDRWWESWSAIRWKETDTSITCLPDYDGNISCQPETETKTYTRCSATKKGDTLPVRYPAPGCENKPGDYFRRGFELYITYSKVGDEKTGKVEKSKIGEDEWDRLVPGRQTTIRLNIFGKMRGLAE